MQDTETSAPTSGTSPLWSILAIPYGAVTGAFAGLIGVGGGEFRIPFLLTAYGKRVKTASAVNLVVGLITVTVAVYRRARTGTGIPDDWIMVGVMVVLSYVGSVLGARMAHRARSGALRSIIIAYLVAVGIWLLYEAFTGTHHVLIDPGSGTMLSWVVAALIGLIIGFLCPVFGIAGGEMRIPAVMYLMAIPIKEAGMISLIASIPTVGAGALVYRKYGHINRRDLPLAILLGIGSIVGVVAGVAVLPKIDPHVLKGILGGILLLAAAGLIMSGRQLHDRGTELADAENNASEG
jgi:uncharacterized membrane protein YfcA